MCVPVISARDEVGLVSSLEIVDTIDALFMALEGEVRVGRSQLPHLVVMVM